MEQISFGIAMLLKPFVLLAGLGMLLAVRFGCKKWLPDGKLKRLLLYSVEESGGHHPQTRAAPDNRVLQK
jgi:hypothetical protein